ncbi:argininosuccinate lyase [Holotrichia oblita]|nr:argininosuccinate lyase [Holotrichia oblita]
MLQKCGIINDIEKTEIINGLNKLLDEIENGKSIENAEDIHSFVENELTKSIGKSGEKLHTARSRNDQVALDFRMYIRDRIDALKHTLIELITVIIKHSEQNLETYMTGFTHLQHAQPTTLAHYLMAYANMFERDIDRLTDCKKRVNVLPLGSCAMATTTLPIDRETVKTLLGFDNVCENSIDGVSDRDFAVEYLAVLSLIMTHLSRMSEELILWSTTEFKFCEISDKFSTGSSIMPQKKNADMLELIRGKTGRVNYWINRLIDYFERFTACLQ